MKPKVAEAIEELVRSAYGTRRDMVHEPADVEELLAGYYGRPARAQASRARAVPVAVAASRDDGEVLRQRGQTVRPRRVTRALSQETQPITISPQREALVDLAPTGEPPQARPQLAPSLKVPAIGPKTPAAPPVSPAVGNTAPAPNAPSASPQAASDAPPPAAPPSPNETVAALRDALAASKPTAAGGKTEEDDFAADLEAILRGDKVYDASSKRTVDKQGAGSSVGATSPAPAQPAPQAPPPPPPISAPQNIFDRIAQSMQYANAYDLGTVDLQDRFAAFDQASDRQRQQDKPQPSGATRGRSPMAQSVGSSSEFLSDLDAIGKRASASDALSLAASTSMRRLSRALYDTGEHVLAAETLYDGRLRVGREPRVGCSYGQLIAMGDMFESVEEMMAASPEEIQAIKALIVRSTSHYRDHSAQRPATREWQSATHDRYLRLAEDNYDHFSPNLLFPNAPYARAGNRHGNHRRAWEQHHKRALQEAQRMAADPAHANTSYFPEWPLIINGFGDHFLTDAFAAGHVINKEEIINHYKSVFYVGAQLTGPARGFIDRVAQRAFTGTVASRFSRLETAQPYDAWWNIFNWNPNIDSASRFAEVLAGIAAQAPDKMGNLMVKVIHDRLNRDGVSVTNDVSGSTWQLTGDGHLSQATLAVMQQAVRQSVDNIQDPSIASIGSAYDPFLQRVWRYVPRLVPSSQQQLLTMVHDLVQPSSAALVEAAAAIIKEEVESLIAELIQRRILQPA